MILCWLFSFSLSIIEVYLKLCFTIISKITFKIYPRKHSVYVEYCTLIGSFLNWQELFQCVQAKISFWFESTVSEKDCQDNGMLSPPVFRAKNLIWWYLPRRQFSFLRWLTSSFRNELRTMSNNIILNTILRAFWESCCHWYLMTVFCWLPPIK